MYKAAYELGVRIPDDLSVVGFDGIEMGEVLGPPLTTLSIFPKKIGAKAAQLLVEAISGQHTRGFREVVMKHALVERASVRSL